MLIPLVEIILDRDQAQCLFDHAKKDSPAWATIKTSLDEWAILTTPTAKVVVHSTHKAARDLLDIALQHCLSAVHQIRLGLENAEPTVD